MSLAGGLALVATLEIEGLEEYEQMLSELSDPETVRAICGETIYAGAKVMADAIRAEIESIPVISQEDNRMGTETDKLNGITGKQKSGLLNGFGVSPMSHRDGYYDVKIGFDGYNSVRTKNYPNGQPNAMIARSVNSGTSFREKNPFVDRAVRLARKETEAAMVAACDDAFTKFKKGR